MSRAQFRGLVMSSLVKKYKWKKCIFSTSFIVENLL